MTKTEIHLRFSIIIPLEFHRGQVEACLKKWVQEQIYPRNQYEIIAVGCRSSLDEETITFFKSLLSDADRLLLFDEPHDMALCVYGATKAKGEILFFTESHVLPESNLLSVVDEALTIHLEWAGLSCQSIRITHNLLSILEADMYEADILSGMQEHAWRKILDQCFAVRAEKYHNAGGFRPELGHFAEWHLAAHMHQKGYQIGYLSEAKVHHYYIGDINELIEFTKDFVQGEITYHTNFINDDCRLYFPEPLEWLMFYQWVSQLTNVALKLVPNAHSKFIWGKLNLGEIIARSRLLIRLCFPANILIKIAFLYAYLDFQQKKFILKFLSKLALPKSRLQKRFPQFIEAVATFERIRCIKTIEEKQEIKNAKSYSESVYSLIWKYDTINPYPYYGFYALEEWQGKKFRWSEPVAVMEIPLALGTYHLELKWLPVRNIKNLIIYINEKPIPASYKDNEMSLFFNVTSDLPIHFALTCEPWIVPNDKRILGLPITSISITLQ